MILSKLSLNNFRNHQQLSLELPSINQPLYISGENGAGKTSIIESIYLLYTLRSFRSQPLNEIKSFNSEYLRIHGEFVRGDIDNATLFYQQERKFLIDGQENSLPLADYSYITPAICYSPSFETLLSSEHSERRQSLDRIVYYTNKTHMANVKQYNQLLQRKRAELDRDRPNETVLDIINEQLAPLSEQISAARASLVADINQAVAESGELAQTLMPDIELSFSANSLDGRDFANEIDKRRPMYGCHKDLLYVKRDGKIIEKFQSFGQKKSCLLFLLYHMATIVQRQRQTDIILLFDDFEAGLDAGRASKLTSLFTSLMDGHMQLILSGIENRHYKEAAELKL
ncbi:MAG: AAA family ATPase [Deferribacteraceae bacterium]|jgi:DNA replication and repair protein RecF|nr:AAA family ATPase [Deferribacteraceae bacterium]